MQHGTRKRPFRALACALVLGLAAAPVWTCSIAFAEEDELELKGGMLGGGGIIGGGDGSMGGSGGGNSFDHVDKPFGQIIRIIPGRGMSALLYLPSLPVNPDHCDEETGHPALQVLYVDLAYEDDPDTWERWGTFEWNADWLQYAWDMNSINPVYDDNYQNPSILYCAVKYSSDTIDYRNFYLRATAVVLEDGTLTTTEFEPALIVYEEAWLPDPEEPDEEPPNIVNPPEVNAGDSGGNRGGVTQGESERVDPAGSPGDLAPSVEKAEAAPLDGATGSGAEATTGDASEAASSVDDTSAKAARAEQSDTATSNNAAASDASNASEAAADENRIPGFAWAIGITAGAVGLAGGAVVLWRARPRRPRG